jgi:hypothetical protein
MLEDAGAPERASWAYHYHPWALAGFLIVVGLMLGLGVAVAFRRRVVAFDAERGLVELRRSSLWPFRTRIEEVDLTSLEAADIVEEKSYRDYNATVVLVTAGRRIDLRLSYSSARRARSIADALESALRSWRRATSEA